MELKLEDDQVKAAVAGAIMTLMTGEQRAKLIEQAIAGLLTEKVRDGNYATDKTRMQKLFEDALVQFARKEIDRLIVEDVTLREKFASVVREGVERAFATEARSKLIESIANGVHKVFEGRGY